MGGKHLCFLNTIFQYLDYLKYANKEIPGWVWHGLDYDCNLWVSSNKDYGYQ